MYIFIHIYIPIYVHACILYVHACIYMHTCVCMHIYLYICICAHTHVCRYTYMCICTLFMLSSLTYVIRFTRQLVGLVYLGYWGPSPAHSYKGRLAVHFTLLLPSCEEPPLAATAMPSVNKRTCGFSHLELAHVQGNSLSDRNATWLGSLHPMNNIPYSTFLTRTHQ